MTLLSNVQVTNQPLTAFGDMRTAVLSPIVQLTFEYTVDNTELLTNTIANSGTVTQASAMAVCTTSAMTDSTALMQSTKHLRYRAGMGALARFTTLFTSPQANSEQLVGVADEAGGTSAFENGYCIGYVGTTFGVHRFSDDVITSFNVTSWDDPLDGTGASGMTLDATKLNVWALQIQYLGAGAVKVWVEDDDTGALVLAHTIDYANSNIVPHTLQPNYKFSMLADNGSSGEIIVVKTASAALFVEGMTSYIETHQPLFSTGNQENTSVTSEEVVFTIRSRSTYHSKTNFIESALKLLTMAYEANNDNAKGTFRMVKNGTLGGTPSWSDINTNNSVMEIDTAATSVTGGEDLFIGLLAGRGDGKVVPMDDLGVILDPGDTISVTCSSSNNATMSAALTWKELF